MLDKVKFSLIIFLSYFLVSVSYAEMVTYEISATVYDVYDPGNVLQGGIPLNAQITGTYTFDITVADNDSSVEYGTYIQTYSGSQGFDLLVNNESLKSDPNVPGYMHEIHIGNSITDHYHIASWGNRPLSNGALVNDINLDLYDDLGMALDSSALSSTPPNPSAFTYRDLYIGGNGAGSGNYYSVMAKVDSISVSSGNANPDLAVYQIEATINNLQDPANALNGSVNLGDALSGTFTVNITTMDDDPTIEYGRYRHLPNTGDYGFDINTAGFNFRTDVNQVEMNVELYNGPAAYDNYMAMSYGNNIPLHNGASVLDIGLYLSDNSGNMLTSDAISANHPSVTNNSYNDIYIFGMHANGVDSYHINATINSINLVTQPSSLVAISPASGVFERSQRFDLALIFPPGIAAVENLTLRINGLDETPALANCYPGMPNPLNQQTFVCPDFSNTVFPGFNSIIFGIDLLDGTHISESVNWEVIGY